MFQCGFRRQQTCLPIHGETLQATNILRRIGKKDLSAWYVHTHGTHISAVYLCLLLYETSVRVYLYGCPSACLTLSESVYTYVMLDGCVCVCVWVCVYADCVMRHPFCQNKGPLASLHSYSDRWDFQPASIFARRLECPFWGSSDGLFDPF